MKLKVILIGDFLDADSMKLTPTIYRVKLLPWRVMGKQLFWSREKLVRYEFDCLRLWSGLRLWLGL